MLPRRHLRNLDAAAFAAASGIFIIGQFWFLYLAPISPLLHGQLFLGGLLAIGFLLMRHRANSGDEIPWHDWVLAALSLVPAAYAAWDYSSFVRRTILTTPNDVLMAGMLVLLLLEVCRRAIGIVLPLIALSFMLAALAGNIESLNAFGFPRLTYTRLAGTLYVSGMGIFSEALQVALRWIFIFLLFGSFLMLAGGQEFFSRLSLALNKRSKGGPAYVAVTSSAFFGMLSGSNMANVMTTGQFTIPLMKQAGYPARIAAAIESVASTGGALTPPIMAAGALIMAEFTARPYFDIVAAATLPAILFYAAVVVYVYAITARLDVRPDVVPMKSETETVRGLLLKNWAILASIIWLIYRVASFYPVERAGLEAIVPLAIGTVIHHRENLHPAALLDQLRSFMSGLVDVGVACAAAGILIGVILLTGAGVELSNALFSLGQDSLLLALVITMLVTIVLGMGVPGIAAYVIAASVIAGPLVQLGVPVIAAHMFIFYFSLFAGLTPPVALTAFAAASIAKSPPFATSVTAMMMALPVYVVAYVFVLEPALLLQGTTVQIIVQFIVALVGIGIFAFGTAGWLTRNLALYERALAWAAGLTLLVPSLAADLISGVFFLLLFLSLWLRKNNKEGSTTPTINHQKETSNGRTTNDNAV